MQGQQKTTVKTAQPKTKPTNLSQDYITNTVPT